MVARDLLVVETPHLRYGREEHHLVGSYQVVTPIETIVTQRTLHLVREFQDILRSEKGQVQHLPSRPPCGSEFVDRNLDKLITFRVLLGHKSAFRAHHVFIDLWDNLVQQGVFLHKVGPAVGEGRILHTHLEEAIDSSLRSHLLDWIYTIFFTSESRVRVHVEKIPVLREGLRLQEPRSLKTAHVPVARLEATRLCLSNDGRVVSRDVHPEEV
mmetsp:Transcript_5098/g.11014  ORF Transcript_5098/g.11014 Transcript_5098/m.11014 type:complete len:213 (-) Transcript_5098:47-685(-)